MPRGGARPGSGRKRKSVQLHRLAGTYRADRHADRQPGGVLLAMPVAANASDWRPTDIETAALSPRAQIWLQAVLQIYQLSGVEGQALLECLRVLSRVEALESEDGMSAAAALVRERKLFLSMWTALRLEK